MMACKQKPTTIKLKGDAANVFLKIQTNKASIEECLAIGIHSLVCDGDVASAVKALKEYKAMKEGETHGT